MNSLQLITKIKNKAADIQSSVEEIFSKENELTTLDKDLLKAQTTAFYELILKLKCQTEEVLPEETIHHIAAAVVEPTVIAQTFSDEIVTEEPTIEETPVQQEFKQVVEQANLDELSLNQIEEIVLDQPEPEIELPEIPSIVHEVNTLPAVEEIPELVEEKQPAKGAENNIFEKHIEKATVNKRIQYTVMPPVEVLKEDENAPTSINERLARLNQSQSLEPKIDNLKTAITLNKKIAFVNDLFKENVVEYAKAIDKLNNAGTIEEAMQYLAEYKRTFNWEGTNQLVNDLEGLVKRKFK